MLLRLMQSLLANSVFASGVLSSAIANASTIAWQNCSIFGYSDSADAIKPECGFYTVPLDYHDSSAGTARLAVVRRRSSGQPYLGTLFVNPGGPGGLGTEYVLTDYPTIVNATGNQHDIVSWDPRGVGYSTPVISCFNSTEQEARYFQPDSVLSFGPWAKDNFTNARHNDPDEIAFWKKEKVTDQQLHAVGSICLQNAGDSLKYVGSVAAVRDMVSLSDTIAGPGKLINYWGVSYGTIIGAYFINMFPSRVGRVILDGVLRANWWSDQPQYAMWTGDLQNITAVFNEFTRACAEAGPPYCAIAEANSTQASIAAWLHEWQDLSFDHPQAENSLFTSAYVRNLIFSAMYSPVAWGMFASIFLETYQATLAISNSSSTTTRSLIDRAASSTHPNLARSRIPFMPHLRRDLTTSLREVQPQRRAEPAGPAFDFADPTVAIACSDAVDIGSTTTADVFGIKVQTAWVDNQLLGPLWFAVDYCHRWPARAVERYRGPWNHYLANKVLVIGNKADCITPLASAKWTADQLGDKAVLLERDGYGHSSLAEPSTCTDSVIAAYFTKGTLPAKGTVCATDRNYFGSPNISSDSSASWTK